MNNIDAMPSKCQNCPYWEICKFPYVCNFPKDEDEKTNEK